MKIKRVIAVVLGLTAASSCALFMSGCSDEESVNYTEFSATMGEFENRMFLSDNGSMNLNAEVTVESIDNYPMMKLNLAVSEKIKRLGNKLDFEQTADSEEIGVNEGLDSLLGFDIGDNNDRGIYVRGGVMYAVEDDVLSGIHYGEMFTNQLSMHVLNMYVTKCCDSSSYLFDNYILQKYLYPYESYFMDFGDRDNCQCYINDTEYSAKRTQDTVTVDLKIKLAHWSEVDYSSYNFNNMTKEQKDSFYGRFYNRDFKATQSYHIEFNVADGLKDRDFKQLELDKWADGMRYLSPCEDFNTQYSSAVMRGNPIEIDIAGNGNDYYYKYSARTNGTITEQKEDAYSFSVCGYGTYSDYKEKKGFTGYITDLCNRAGNKYVITGRAYSEIMSEISEYIKVNPNNLQCVIVEMGYKTLKKDAIRNYDGLYDSDQYIACVSQIYVYF